MQEWIGQDCENLPTLDIPNATFAAKVRIRVQKAAFKQPSNFYRNNGGNSTPGIFALLAGETVSRTDGAILIILS